MWHRIPRHSGSGACEYAAPLFISGLRMRYYWHGAEILEKDLQGKLDTGSEYTCIPLHLAKAMCLPSKGKIDDLRTFDYSFKLPSFPMFSVELFVPKWGWSKRTVLGCHRDDILLGLDYCKDMLLLVNWRTHGFGLRRAKRIHQPLQILFTRLKKVRAD
jgi:hypothetical protein